MRGIEHRILVRAAAGTDEAVLSVEEEKSDMGNVRRDSPGRIEIEDNASRAEATGKRSHRTSGPQGTYTEYLGEN